MSDRSSSPPGSRADVVLVALVGLFAASLMLAQVLAAKVVGVPLGGTYPLVGDAVLVPAGVLAYALTYFATDCLSELYGMRTARTVVGVGFALILAELVLIALAMAAPSAWALGVRTGVDPADFGAVLGFTPAIVLGSVAGYVLSQNWDVVVFHAIRDRTGPEHLWLRNVGSTASSQLLDTVVFISIGFWLGPVLLGTGTAPPLGVLLSLVVGQYVVKLLIAVLDTPFVYAVVASVR